MDCFHWCPIGPRSTRGHDWSHTCKGDEALDPYRLYCEVHGALVGDFILGKANVLEQRASQEVREEGREDMLPPASRFIFTQRGQEQSCALALERWEAECEVLFSL